jgi:hypothetical protein
MRLRGEPISAAASLLGQEQKADEANSAARGYKMVCRSLITAILVLDILAPDFLEAGLSRR